MNICNLYPKKWKFWLFFLQKSLSWQFSQKMCNFGQFSTSESEKIDFFGRIFTYAHFRYKLIIEPNWLLTWKCPFLEASWSGVSRAMPGWLTKAPCLNNNFATERLPRLHASWRGDQPEKIFNTSFEREIFLTYLHCPGC